jgi:hypothetical protein
MAANLKPPQIAEIIRLTDLGYNNTQISRELGIKRDSARNYANPRRKELVGAAVEQQSLEAPEATSPPSWKEKGDEATLGLNVSEPISTLEQLIAVAKIDTNVWTVDSWECTAWNSITKDKAWDAHLHQLWRVHAKLKRIAPKPYLEALDALFAKKELLAPKSFNRPPYKPGKVMVLFSLADVHFGKLAWGRETGQDYDLKIAEAVFENAVEDLLMEVKDRDIDCIYTMFGNDFFHSDNDKNETTNGTRVDSDGRQAKVIEVGMRAQIRAIDRWRNVAPVKIWGIGGNHDKANAHWGAREIRAWFRNDPGVEIDIEPRERKYLTYGNTMFGFTHGENISDAKIKELPGLFTTEGPRAMVASTTRCEWILAHRHREQEFTQRGTDSHMGCTMRWMLSLSATDAWHNQKLFIGNTRAAEVLVYNKEQGFKGKWLAIARA